MSAPDQETLQEWLIVIENDLDMIENAIRGKFVSAAVAFHAQQASEKMLKLVIASQGIRPPYIHDLAKLLDLIQRDFPLREQMLALREFENMHLAGRYPDHAIAIELPSLVIAKDWLQNLRKIKNDVAAIILSKEKR